MLRSLRCLLETAQNSQRPLGQSETGLLTRKNWQTMIPRPWHLRGGFSCEHTGPSRETRHSLSGRRLRPIRPPDGWFAKYADSTLPKYTESWARDLLSAITSNLSLIRGHRLRSSRTSPCFALIATGWRIGVHLGQALRFYVPWLLRLSQTLFRPAPLVGRFMGPEREDPAAAPHLD